MKKCLNCNTTHNESNWHCPNCGYSPDNLEGINCFASHLAKENTGFQDKYYDDLYELENKNFWFKSRNKLICWAMKRFFPNSNSFLEIGCGTGYVLSGIRDSVEDIRLIGSELFLSGIRYASNRNKDIEFYQMDARKIPFEDEFDVIGAFDVLEHIEEDEFVLAEMYRSIIHGGGIIVTVPQHPFMWSRADDCACHVRRYTVDDIKMKIEKCGFKIEKITSFVTLLFPAMMISRFLMCKKKFEYDPKGELKINPLLNVLFYLILTLERILIIMGIQLPFGGSLLIIGRKV